MGRQDDSNGGSRAPRLSTRGDCPALACPKPFRVTPRKCRLMHDHFRQPGPGELHYAWREGGEALKSGPSWSLASWKPFPTLSSSSPICSGSAWTGTLNEGSLSI